RVHSSRPRPTLCKARGKADRLHPSLQMSGPRPAPRSQWRRSLRVVLEIAAEERGLLEIAIWTDPVRFIGAPVEKWPPERMQVKIVFLAASWQDTLRSEGMASPDPCNIKTETEYIKYR